jgi:hypothetical protein
MDSASGLRSLCLRSSLRAAGAALILGRGDPGGVVARAAAVDGSNSEPSAWKRAMHFARVWFARPQRLQVSGLPEPGERELRSPMPGERALRSHLPVFPSPLRFRSDVLLPARLLLPARFPEPPSRFLEESRDDWPPSPALPLPPFPSPFLDPLSFLDLPLPPSPWFVGCAAAAGAVSPAARKSTSICLLSAFARSIDPITTGQNCHERCSSP